MDTERVHLYFHWERMDTFLLRNIEQLLVLYSVTASARKTLEKSFALGELWDQRGHKNESTGRDSSILWGQLQTLPSSSFDRKSLR